MKKVSLRNILLTASAFAVILPASAIAQEVNSGDLADAAGETAAQPEAARTLSTVVVTSRRTGENLQDAPIAITSLDSEALEQLAVQNVTELNRSAPGVNLVQPTVSPFGLQMNIRGQVSSDTAAFSGTVVGAYLDDTFLGQAGISGSLLNFDDLQRVEVLRGPQGTLYGRNVTGGVIRFITAEPVDEFEGYVQAGTGNYGRQAYSGMLNVPISDDMAFRIVGSYQARDGYSYDIRSQRDLDDLEQANFRANLQWKPTDDFQMNLKAWYGQGSNGGADQRIVYFQPGLTPAAFSIMVAEGFNGVTAGTLAPLIFGGTPQQVGAAAGAALGALPQVNALVAQSMNASRDRTLGDPNYPQFTDSDTEGFSGTLAWDLGNVELKSISSYTAGSSDRAFHVGGGPTTLLFTEQKGENTQYTQEFQANGTAFDDRLTYAAGLFYLRSDIVDTRDQSSRDGAFIYVLGQRGLGVTSGSITENTAEIESTAVYGQASYALTDTINATLGLRYTDESMNTDSNGIQLPNLTTGGNARCIGPAPNTVATPIADCGGSAGVNHTNWSYTAGLDWSLTPDVLVYAKTSRGFKAGGVNVFAAAYAPISPFDPEQNTEHEVGIKSEWFANRLRLNATYYNTSYEDIQRTVAFEVTPGLIVTAVQNAAEATINGAELETQFVAADGLTLSANAAWTDAGYDSYPVFNATFPNRIKDQSGFPFQGLSEWTYNIGASYDFDIAERDVNARIGYSWRDDAVLFENDLLPNVFGSTAFAPESALTQEAFGLLDASVSIDLPKYNSTLTVWGKNLTDEKFFVSMISLVNNGVGTGWGNLGAPMTFGADLKVRF